MIRPAASFPVFIVKNLQEAKTFYTAWFSFSVAFENEWYLHIVSESGVQAGFMLPDQPSQPEIFHAGYSGEGVIFSLEVEDVDQAYATANDHNLDIVLTLRCEEWGQRHFSLKDPNGIYLDIIQNIEPSEEYQQEYTNT